MNPESTNDAGGMILAMVFAVAMCVGATSMRESEGHGMAQEPPVCGGVGWTEGWAGWIIRKWNECDEIWERLRK